MLALMANDQTEDAAQIGPLLRQAHLSAARAFAEVLRPFGIEGRHYGVLHQLDRHGPMSQRRLTDLSGEDKSSMVRAIDDLERLGLAVRRPDPTDRRANAVELTDAGRRLRAEAGSLAGRSAARMLDGFSTAERDTFLDLLRRFIVDATTTPTKSSS